MEANRLNYGLLMNEKELTKKWSGRADLNGRPPAPKAGALTRLRYAPTSTMCKEKLTHYQGQNNSTKSAANREMIV